MEERLISSLGEDYSALMNFLKYSIYALFLTLSIDIDIIKALSVIMFLDTILGMLKSYRLKIPLRFETLMWGLTAKFLVILIPLIIAVLGKYVHKDFIWTVDLVIKLLIVNEVLSMLANIQSVRLNKHVKNYDLITFMIDGIRKRLFGWSKAFLSTQLNKIKNENE